jgi:hypothetical protein
MTPKQEERIKIKIKRIKAELAADKKRWGGYYDDSRGLRYLPPALYLKLEDYSGGLRYTNWFKKNFPDDCGFPDFLFEWTIILFKSGKYNEAEKKAFETYFSNTYLFEKFFGRPIVPIDKYEHSNVDIPSFCDFLEYSSGQAGLSDFSDWLAKFLLTEKFASISTKFIEINKRLKVEEDSETRLYLIRQARQLEEKL